MELILEKEAVYSDFSDEELIIKFQNNDLRSYNELVNRYKDPLFNFVYRFLNDMQATEDVLQETFLRLYKNKSYYKEVAKFSTWIYTIAGNLAKTELRRRKRRNIFSIHNYVNEEKDFEIIDGNLLPDADVENRNTYRTITEAIEKLPETFKEVIVLRDIQNLEYDEISEIVNAPLGTVKSRINRGRARLAKMLKGIIE